MPVRLVAWLNQTQVGGHRVVVTVLKTTPEKLNHSSVIPFFLKTSPDNFLFKLIMKTAGADVVLGEYNIGSYSDFKADGQKECKITLKFPRHWPITPSCHID